EGYMGSWKKGYGTPSHFRARKTGRGLVFMRDPSPSAPYGSLALRPELKPRGGGKLVRFLMQCQLTARLSRIPDIMSRRTDRHTPLTQYYPIPRQTRGKLDQGAGQWPSE